MDKRSRISSLGPGLLLGAGLGGFVDGIVLHQILQWHHLLSSTEDPATLTGLRVNTLWDGLFHAVAWVFVAIGLLWLWRRVTGSGAALSRRSLVGLLLAGWGLFNLVEGLVNHHLLGIHHVREGADHLPYDLGFLAFGTVLLAVGCLLYRTRHPVVDG
jgi:uncharacterized membrane protein